MEHKELIDVIVVQLHDTMIFTTRKILPPFGACACCSVGGGGGGGGTHYSRGDIIHRGHYSQGDNIHQ